MIAGDEDKKSSICKPGRRTIIENQKDNKMTAGDKRCDESNDRKRQKRRREVPLGRAASVN